MRRSDENVVGVGIFGIPVIRVLDCAARDIRRTLVCITFLLACPNKHDIFCVVTPARDKSSVDAVWDEGDGGHEKIPLSIVPGQK